jgi:hypothetical protein
MWIRQQMKLIQSQLSHMSVFKSQSWLFLIDVVNQVHVAWNGVHFGI